MSQNGRKLSALKTVVLTFGLVLFAAVVAAQIGGQPFGEGSGFASLADLITRFFSSITPFEFESVSSVATYIFMVLVLYGIELNFLDPVFKGINNALESSNSNFSTSSDGYPRSTKIVAFGLAWIAATAFGTVFFSLMPVMALLGFLLLFAGRLRQSGSGIRSMVPGGSGGSSSGSDEVATDGGLSEEELMTIKETLDDAGGKEEDAEQTGNEAEAEEAEQEIEYALEGIEDSEVKLEGMLESTEGDLEKAINEAKEILQEEKAEQEDIEQVQGRLQALEEILGELDASTELYAGAIQQHHDQGIAINQALQNQFSGASVNFQPGDIAKVNNGVLSPYVTDNNTINVNSIAQGWITPSGAGLNDAEEALQEIEQIIEEIAGIEQQEDQEIEDEIQRVVREANRFVEAYKMIQEIKSLLEEAEKEDKGMEKVAEELDSEKLYKGAKKEESQEEQLEEQLNQLMDMEGTIESELETAEELLEEERELDVQEIKELRQELQELEETREIVGRLASVSREFVDSDQVYQRFANIEQGLETAEQELGQVEQRKEQVEQHLEEAEQRVKQAISQV